VNELYQSDVSRNMRNMFTGYYISRCGWCLTRPGRPGGDGALYIPNYPPE